eukprot:1619181-Heterocapsa_arctica.AAC.1
MAVASAPGADSMRPRELKLWPTVAWQWAAILLNTVERTGVWPEQMCTLLMPAIPKVGGGCRLLALASALYRGWSAARLRPHEAWQESWAP